MARIAVVGLGAMGLPIAETLAGRGFEVIGFDIAAERRGLFPDTVDSLEALSDCATAVLSLPNDQIVADVAGRLIALLRRGALVIDTSTVAPDTTRRLHDQAHARGLAYVDAPVSGGAAGAAGASLLVMAGGAPGEVAAAHPILDALARKVVHCGGPGAGNVVKLINNMLCAGQLILVGEALRMAAAGNVTTDTLLDAINTGSGRSAVTEVNLPRWVLSGAYDSAFTMALMTKDVELAAGLDGAGPISGEIAVRWRTGLERVGAHGDFNRIVDVEVT